MNDKLKTLIKENLTPDAYMTYKGYLLHAEDPKIQDHSDPLPLYSEYDFEKFAQLIVRDCLKQIYYNTLMSHPEHNWSEKEIGFNEGVDAAYKKVKKHFGVEE